LNIPAIEVRAWGKRVGALARDPRLEYIAFKYAPSWLQLGIELAPLHLPLSDQTFVFPDLPETTFRRLPAMFADALPDDFGNALIDAWMAGRGTKRADITTLDRLAYMGKRGMGALEFKPALGSHRESVEPLELQSLVEEARRAVEGELTADAHAKAALANIIRVGTSAGGARAKAVVAWNPATNQIRSGQFDMALGFEPWLLKFDGVGKDFELGTSGDYGRTEYAYYKMATQAGITMSPSRLLEENDRAHFMTRRFDRDVIAGITVKHHTQTLCAMAHLDYRQRGTHSYSQLFITISELELADEAVRQAFLRMTFNVMTRNYDDHAKNFSFLRKRDEGWQLAPAYDVTHAHNPRGEWTYQHLMSVNGKFDGITRGDLLAEAERFSVPRAEELVTDVRSAIGSWTEHAKSAGLNQTKTDELGREFLLL